MSPPMHLEEEERELTRRLQDVRAQNALLARQGNVIAAELASVRTNLETRRPPPIARPSEPVREMHPLVRALVVSSLFGIACALIAYVGMTLHAAADPKMPSPPPTPPAVVVRTVEVPGPTKYVAVAVMPKGSVRLPAAPPTMGWVLVEGAPGARVYERGRFVGATPFVAMLPLGDHTLRVEGGRFAGETTSKIVRVESSGTEVAITPPYVPGDPK